MNHVSGLCLKSVNVTWCTITVIKNPLQKSSQKIKSKSISWRYHESTGGSKNWGKHKCWFQMVPWMRKVLIINWYINVCLPGQCQGSCNWEKRVFQRLLNILACRSNLHSIACLYSSNSLIQPWPAKNNYISKLLKPNLESKVHIFWEGHKD